MEKPWKIYAWFFGGFLMPPVMWLFVNLYSGLVNGAELVQLALSPLLIIYVLGYISILGWIMNRMLTKISACCESSSGQYDTSIHKYMMYPPWIFIIAEIIYCIVGPNTALLGKSFMDWHKYLLSWMFGIPIILAYSVPFFTFFLQHFDRFTCRIPIGSEYFNIKNKFYISNSRSPRRVALFQGSGFVSS